MSLGLFTHYEPDSRAAEAQKDVTELGFSQVFNGSEEGVKVTAVTSTNSKLVWQKIAGSKEQANQFSTQFSRNLSDFESHRIGNKS